jgi:formate hydrogenlyase transcriptional activator
VEGFQLVAQVFANALARKRADETLRESEAGLWIVEPETGHVWATAKTRELYILSRMKSWTMKVSSR